MTRKSDRLDLKPASKISLVDCHCHFPLDPPPRGIPYSYETQYEEFFRENGQFLVTSTNYYGYQITYNFAQNHPNIYMTYGWGPQTVTYSEKSKHDRDFSKFLEFIQKNAKKFIGIGEIGLDFHHAKKLTDRERQISVFEKIIQETKYLGLPYSLHVRNAGPNDKDPDLPQDPYNERDRVNNIITEILEDENIPPDQVMWHCFSGPAEWGPYLAKQGYYLSVPASAYGFRRWRRNFEGVLIESLLTETDSAWQHPYKIGEFNVPLNVKYAVAAIAYLQQKNQQEVSEIILKNALKFFHFPK